METYTLNAEQATAIAAITEWLKPENTEQFMVLKGGAGTGKTFCVRQLTETMRGKLVFTAPTNKATKVLRESVTTKDYKPECRTIYSLLGLRLEASGEVKVLTARSNDDEPLELEQYRCIIVDEASMVNDNLREHIHNAANKFGLKFLFLGDEAQLPPVGEARSSIWRIRNVVELSTVMRHDNQILTLATHLRSLVDHATPKLSIADDYDDSVGVRILPTQSFVEHIMSAADNGDFSEPNSSKVIAWRNVTVDRYNRIIRGRIFPGATQPWLVDDRVLFMAPGRDLEDRPMASTDDEGRVARVMEDWHPIYGDFRTWRVSITLDDNRTVIAQALHESSLTRYTEKVQELGNEANANRKKWKDFWAFKEAFHQLRHAYALTAHRAQGSTYQTVFVDYKDILLNRTKPEAMRCLYVAATRSKEWLYLG